MKILGTYFTYFKKFILILSNCMDNIHTLTPLFGIALSSPARYINNALWSEPLIEARSSDRRPSIGWSMRLLQSGIARN